MAGQDHAMPWCAMSPANWANDRSGRGRCRSITLADPESFLDALWSSLRLPDGRPTELFDQYISAIQTTRFTPRVAPRGVDRIAHNYEIIRCLMNNRRLDECRYAVNAVLSSSPEFTAAQVSQILYKDGWLTHPYAKNSYGREKLDERTYDFWNP